MTKLVCERWVVEYQSMELEDTPQDTLSVRSLTNPHSSMTNIDVCGPHQSKSTVTTGTSSYFGTPFLDDEYDTQAHEQPDELERYLNADIVRQAENPIAWWMDHKHAYPRLSRMALDYLTIPGMFLLFLMF